MKSEDLKNNYDIANKLKAMQESYVKKEELIDILNNLDFKAVRRCDIELITGFLVDFESGEINPLSKNLEIS